MLHGLLGNSFVGQFHSETLSQCILGCEQGRYKACQCQKANKQLNKLTNAWACCLQQTQKTSLVLHHSTLPWVSVVPSKSKACSQASYSQLCWSCRHMPRQGLQDRHNPPNILKRNLEEGLGESVCVCVWNFSREVKLVPALPWQYFGNIWIYSVELLLHLVFRMSIC